MPSQFSAVILLPKTLNPNDDGYRAPIDQEHFHRTASEVTEAFGSGATLYMDAHTMGVWRNKDLIVADNLAVLQVDALDVPENRAWLKEFVRNVLLDRFQQEEIHMTFYPAESVNISRESITRSVPNREENASARSEKHHEPPTKEVKTSGGGIGRTQEEG